MPRTKRKRKRTRNVKKKRRKLSVDDLLEKAKRISRYWGSNVKQQKIEETKRLSLLRKALEMEPNNCKVHFQMMYTGNAKSRAIHCEKTLMLNAEYFYNQIFGSRNSSIKITKHLRNIRKELGYKEVSLGEESEKYTVKEFWELYPQLSPGTRKFIKTLKGFKRLFRDMEEFACRELSILNALSTFPSVTNLEIHSFLYHF